MEKKKISAKIIADSIDERGNRITSYILTYPRIIHAEVMTHRMFSRNAASSRAIPFAKMLKDIQEDPFIPIAWQKAHSGMQGSEYWTEEDEVRIDIGNEFEYIEDIQPITEEFKIRWLEARDKAVNIAIGMNNLGLTKQLCNRLLEPFQWYTCLVTFTEGDNFFELRCPRYEYSGEEFRSRKDAINSYTFKVGFEKERLYLTSLTELDWIKLSKSQAEIHIQALAEAMWDARNESIPKVLKANEWHLPMIEIIED